MALWLSSTYPILFRYPYSDKQKKFISENKVIVAHDGNHWVGLNSSMCIWPSERIPYIISDMVDISDTYGTDLLGGFIRLGVADSYSLSSCINSWEMATKSQVRKFISRAKFPVRL